MPWRTNSANNTANFFPETSSANSTKIKETLRQNLKPGRRLKMSLKKQKGISMGGEEYSSVNQFCGYLKQDSVSKEECRPKCNCWMLRGFGNNIMHEGHVLCYADEVIETKMQVGGGTWNVRNRWRPCKWWIRKNMSLSMGRLRKKLQAAEACRRGRLISVRTAPCCLENYSEESDGLETVTVSRAWVDFIQIAETMLEDVGADSEDEMEFLSDAASIRKVVRGESAERMEKKRSKKNRKQDLMSKLLEKRGGNGKKRDDA